jgi:hypothetical protein
MIDEPEIDMVFASELDDCCMRPISVQLMA